MLDLLRPGWDSEFIHEVYIVRPQRRASAQIRVAAPVPGTADVVRSAITGSTDRVRMESPRCPPQARPSTINVEVAVPRRASRPARGRRPEALMRMRSPRLRSGQARARVRCLNILRAISIAAIPLPLLVGIACPGTATGDPLFGARADFGTGQSPVSVAIGDLNAD